MGAAEICSQLREALAPTGAPIIGTGAVEDADRHHQVEPAQFASDRFEIGSITKAVVGLVLAHVVLDGTAGLDARIDTWIEAGRNGGITIEQLATHTSGLPRLSPNALNHPGFDPADPYARFDTKLAEEGLRAADLTDVGTYGYSNFGFQVLGICLERMTGKPLASLFDESVFGPAGMADATIDHTLGVLTGDCDGEPVANWTMRLYGPGGINATVADLVALVAAVLEPPTDRFAEAVALAVEPRATGPGGAVGLGWLVHPAGIACCGGATAGFSSYVAAHLADRRGVAMVMNRSKSEALQAAALAAAQGRDPRAGVPVPFEGDPAPWTGRALNFFRCFTGEYFETVHALLNPVTAETLTSERLRAGWTQVAGGCGELGPPVVTDVARVNGMVQVTLVAEGSVKPLTMRTWIDGHGWFTGVRIN